MNALFKFALKGSAVGAMVFLAAAAGCSDSSKDDDTSGGGDSGNNKAGSSSKAGSASKAGASNGGDATDGGVTGNGGASSAGASTGGASEGGDTTAQGGVENNGDAGGPDIVTGQGGELGNGAGGAGTGPSVGKFCNTLTFGKDATTMVLVVGEGADKVTFTVPYGSCSPADSEACTTLPQGAEVPITLFDEDDLNTPLDEKVAEIGAGEDWIFFTDLEGSGQDAVPIVGGGPLNKTSSCESITYDDI